MTVKGFDVEGLGYAMSVTAFTQFIFTLLYTSCVASISAAIHCPNAQSLRGWCQYMSLAMPVVIMLCSDWWAFEILTIISGLIGVSEQATFVIIANLSAQIYMVPVGIQEATCVMIGNAIGQ